MRTSTCALVAVSAANTAERDEEGVLTLASKQNPSVPRMQAPNTLRTAQQPASGVPTMGRDMVEAVPRDEEDGRAAMAQTALAIGV